MLLIVSSTKMAIVNVNRVLSLSDSRSRENPLEALSFFLSFSELFMVYT